ncbi:hypothetical protein E2562_007529 [Oryza meyeriana var. granulata]|uniref:DUF868 domain-containing protein n=1 Tax=Oryza meyeriana var. granulata TaxID=110450 RepID=A0A6G1DVL6_9ORYZ|nr:hypothetical protein E2562_007529 [Oryza meyeriana var. granulata]
MMQDLFSVPSCFSSGEKLPDIPSSGTVATRSGQSAVTLVYRAEISGHSRLVTVTWCRNLLTHGLSVSIEGSVGNGKDKIGREYGEAAADGASGGKSCSACKVEMQPWHFWRKYGAKQFQVDGNAIDVVWDLRSARFSDEPEPLSDYYVAMVSGEEVVLLLGNLKKEAFRRTGSRPSLQDAVLVCKKEHVFSKKRFLTKARFHDKGKLHDISIECSSSNLTGGMDVDMVIKIDGSVNVLVRHLQWKFRGNECISINKLKVQVYWDAHDWLFGTGMRHALFIFKPEPPSPGASSDFNIDEYSDFCLFLYAWKVE